MGLFDWLKKKNVCNQTQVNKPSERHATGDFARTTIEDEQPSLEILIKNSFPSQGGLYPHEILMLSYADTYKTSGNNFQNFWQYQYSVKNPQNVINALLNRGFIAVGDLKSVLEKLKVTELKECLNENGQKTTGKKDELIERIINTCDLQALEHKYSDRYYVLTEKGQEEIKQNGYVIYLHRHQYMTVWEMNKRLNLNNPSGLGYRDILWGEFNRLSGEQSGNADFGLYRNTRLSMCNFLIEEKKYKNALRMIVEVASFDLSGLGNGDKPALRKYMSGDDIVRHKMVNLYSDDNTEIITYPGIIKIFVELQQLLSMTDSEYANYIYQEFAQISIHERVFNAEECANIVLSQLGLEERKIKNSYKIAEQRLKKVFC